MCRMSECVVWEKKWMNRMNESVWEWVNEYEEWNVSGRLLDDDYDLWLHRDTLCKGKNKGKIIL